MIHWTIWTDDSGRWRSQKPSWREAFEFMDTLVALTDDHGNSLFREVCYQRLPEGVVPTA